MRRLLKLYMVTLLCTRSFLVLTFLKQRQDGNVIPKDST